MGEGGVKVYSGVAVVAQIKFFKAVEGGRERGVWVGRERERGGESEMPSYLNLT